MRNRGSVHGKGGGGGEERSSRRSNLSGLPISCILIWIFSIPMSCLGKSLIFKLSWQNAFLHTNKRLSSTIQTIRLPGHAC